MKKIYLLFSVVVSIALLLAAFGVSTASISDGCNTLPGLPSYAVPVTRQCQINLNAAKTQYVTILAGPDSSQPNGLANQFPIPCKNGDPNNINCVCGDPTLIPYCLQWQYQWTLTGGGSLTNALTSAATDVTVFASNPSGATVLQPLIAMGERFINFPISGKPTTFTGSYYTSPNITPGTLTAGFTGINGFWPLLGRCALAGAENLTVPANLATPANQTQTFSIPGPCVFSVSVDPTTGKVIPNTIRLISGSETDCSIIETTSITVDGKPVINIGAGQWTELGSCSYCFANGIGGKTCTTCKTCSVKNGVCSK
jgi:hypothetical protein